MSDLDRLFDDLPHVSQLVDLIYPFNIDGKFQTAVDTAIDRGKRIHKQLEEYIINQKQGKARQRRWNTGIEMPLNELELSCVINAIKIITVVWHTTTYNIRFIPELTLDNGKYMGTIDLVVEYWLDGQLEFIDIIDWKTSSSKSRIDAHTLQLYFYRELILNKYNDIDPDCVQVIPVYLNPKVSFDFNKIHEQVNNDIVKKDMLSKIDKIKQLTNDYQDMEVNNE